jgi:glycine oxidase
VVGLAVARRLAGDGAEVTLLDPSPGGGATLAAAGMIAPVNEAAYGEEALLRLNLRSAAAWRDFAAGLEEETGSDVSYETSGTLSVAHDPGDGAVLQELRRFHTGLGLPSELIGPTECRRREPLLAPRIRAGLDVPGDHRVDPRKVAAALLKALRALGCRIVGEAAASAAVSGDRLKGVVTASGEEITADETVLAAGWESSRLPGLPPDSVPPVRPVKGQILRLRLDPSLPRPLRTVRALVRGSSVYVVPREDGEIVVGATVEERGEDTAVTAGAVYELLRDAQAVLPVLAEGELAEVLARLRPGTPDNAPLVGRGGLEGLILATGHYRHGVLLAPVTAEIVSSLVTSGKPPPFAEWSVCDPGRFAGPATGAR